MARCFDSTVYPCRGTSRFFEYLRVYLEEIETKISRGIQISRGVLANLSTIKEMRRLAVLFGAREEIS
jgi:hypothetical protein